LTERRDRAAQLSVTLHWLFVIALGCLALVLFQVERALPAEWAAPFRLACGSILLAGGLVFLPTRVGARRRLLGRRGVVQPGRVRRGRWRSILLDLLIQLAALFMLVAAVFELVLALTHYV
jgi:hypothetical protein